MAGYGLCGDAFLEMAFDPAAARFPFVASTSAANAAASAVRTTHGDDHGATTADAVRLAWPLTFPIDFSDAAVAAPADLHSIVHALQPSPAVVPSSSGSRTPPMAASMSTFASLDDPTPLFATWPLHPSPSRASYSHMPPALPPHAAAHPYDLALSARAIDYMPAPAPAILPIDPAFLAMESSSPAQAQASLAGPAGWSWEDLTTELVSYPAHASAFTNFTTGSPTDTTYLEVRSLTSSSSEHGWATVDRTSFDSHRDPPPAVGAVHNPSETLHLRTYSDSSTSDGAGGVRHSWDGFDDLSPPLTSPASDGPLDLSRLRDPAPAPAPAPGPASPAAVVAPVPIRPGPTESGMGPAPLATSPPARRAARKSPPTKPAKPAVRRPSHPPRKEAEKRVGRRRGPLSSEQRKQAGEIRKLRACLRCKFLKKTCDKGEPCAGCQPSHARLWQVPCTRIDIKDVAYFMKDWKADFERHVSLGFSVGNIRGFSTVERQLFITHGYGGFVLPVTVREVYVRDEQCLSMDWVESDHSTPLAFIVPTARLSAGVEGISTAALSEYIEQHLDGGFEAWVDNFFGRTPFMPDVLKTAYRFNLRERLPVIRKALKLVVAYNLTMHITLVEGLAEDESLPGKVTDGTSRFWNKTLAPVMINFEIKCALAEMWRQLQKEILEELSALYSSVYSKEKLKNWPIIFLLAAILLAVWEEMQFDCHYRGTDQSGVAKFCQDMETVPVGVIVGLFAAISQKVPAFQDWDTRKHHQQFNSNPAVCDALTEVREHVLRHETYLRGRAEAKFDRNDFDSLSNKFLSKLVIRAN
ncbi:MAG: hypothetical protein M1826_007060 [Phylliscum demangeonii]|nr:MAG: hypothetical protein M1826_007060 [Phylliscum demangeonii]